MQKRDMIILGGNSKKNIAWIEAIKQEYNNDYNAYGVFYNSWNEEEKDINIEEELAKLSIYNNNHNNYIVIAKSMGAIITLLATTGKIIKPKTIILLGIPLKYISDKNYDLINLFNNAKTKSKLLVIQQINDYQCSLNKLIKEIPNDIPLLAIPGNDHTYNDIKNIKKIIDTIIN